MRTYSELIKISSLEDRFNYLRLYGTIGEDTFGSYRYTNQNFYKSYEWQKFRNEIITRDMGCELAFPNEEIVGKIIIHHIEPITIKDIIEHNMSVLINPDNVVCVSENMHKMIHYGIQNGINKVTYEERRPNDTCPWKICKGELA